jgi:AcrR family transcriptional regulator
MSSQKSTDATNVAREPKRERGKLRVTALLDAGATVFAEKGYDAATMTEIAARANTAIGSLYQFFPSKEALVDALLARYGERTGDALREIEKRAPLLQPDALATALLDFVLELRSERASMISLIDRWGSADDKRMLIRNSLRQHLAAIFIAANPALAEAKARRMAIVVVRILKFVPELAQEEAAGHAGLIDEAREVLRLYIAHGLERLPEKLANLSDGGNSPND